MIILKKADIIKMFLKKYFYRISNRIFWVYIITFFVILLLMGGTILGSTRLLLMNQLGSARADVLKQIGERTRSIHISAITISNLYSNDPMILSALEQQDDSIIGETMHTYLSEQKKRYDRTFEDVGIQYEVVIIGENGFNYASKGDYDFHSFQKQLWFRSYYSKESELEFITSFKDRFGVGEETTVFGVFRNITDRDGKRLGTLVIKMKEEILSEVYKNVTDKENHIYIVDKDGKIVSDTEKSRLGIQFIGMNNFQEIYGDKNYHTIHKSDGDYLLSYYSDEQTGWTTIEEIPCRILFLPLYHILKILFVVISLCLVIALVVSGYISKSISVPLLRLCDTMNQVEKGNLDVISEIKGYEEIDRLKNSFNDMAAMVKQLLEEIRLKETYKRELQLEFLRLQINPHFLYNTLFSIQCLTESGRNREAVFMMSAFIDLLRGTLVVNDELIEVQKEVSNVEKYLCLQQLRYRDRVSFELDLAQDSKECCIPSFLLQPIVENAIFHGIEAKGEPGMIIVESKVEGEKLYLSVIDDGVGMNQEAINDLKACFEREEYHKDGAIGMSNVCHRLRLHFGPEYGITLKSELGIGTCVTLCMPIIKK